MPRYTFLVFSNPVEGREPEFNDWYTNTHVKDLLQQEGFISARRFRSVDVDPSPPSPLPRYLAIYEIETDDLSKVQQTMVDRAASGQVVLSDSLDTSSFVMQYFEPVTDTLHG